MRRLFHWGMALGLMVLTPALVTAGPGSQRTAQQAAAHNQQLAQAVAGQLRPLKLTTKSVNIEAQDGHVRLTGYILTAEQKARADQAAWKVRGVRSVRNELIVMQRTAAAPMTRPTRSRIRQVAATNESPRSNQQVAEAIGQALSQQKLSGYEIEVRYSNGVAQLSGSVPTKAQWMAASQATAAVPGVNQVKNVMRVSQPGTPALNPFQVASQQQPGVTAPQPRPAGPLVPAPPNGAAPMQPGGLPPGATVPPQMAPPGMAPPMQPAPYGHPGAGAASPMYNQPRLPSHAWPSYAAYPNSAAVSYPKEYSASAWPYIGPFYPYPQVPLGWRKSTLEWDDGYWNLSFDTKTDKWFWFMHPKNW